MCYFTLSNMGSSQHYIVHLSVALSSSDVSKIDTQLQRFPSHMSIVKINLKYLPLELEHVDARSNANIRILQPCAKVSEPNTIWLLSTSWS